MNKIMRPDLEIRNNNFQRELFGEELGNKVINRTPLSNSDCIQIAWNACSKLITPICGDRLFIERERIINEEYFLEKGDLIKSVGSYLGLKYAGLIFIAYDLFH